MEMSEIIESERIILERAKPTFALAKEIFAAVEESRENLRPWLSWCDKTHAPEDSFGYLLNWCEKHWQEKKGFAYVIRDKMSKKFLGSIDLMEVHDTHKSGDIGYWIRSSAQGFGYMHEAVLALEKEAFHQGFHRITIGNDTRNIRSANVAQRAGYHLDGVLRQNRWDEFAQKYIDSNVWSKLDIEYTE